MRRSITAYLLSIMPAALTALFILGIIPADAQTCRVAMGFADNGTPCYREVYEYDYVTEKPTFPGGDSKLIEFINSTRKYPKNAYRKGIQGRVTCSFIVNTDGSVSNVRVLRKVENSLDHEAVRIIGLMPDWHPGSINGVKVPVRVIRSIPFRK